MRIGQRVESLGNDVDRLLVRQLAALGIGEPGRIRALDVFGNQIDGAVMRTAFEKPNDVWMFERGRDIDLAHEASQSLLSNSNFRKQGFDRDGTAGLLFPRQHDAAHSTAA